MRTKLVVYPALAMAAVLCGTTAAAQASNHPVTATVDKANRPITPRVSLHLDAPSYGAGDTARLRVSENIRGARTFTVHDSSGAVWTQQSDNGTTATFTATTTSHGGDVNVRMTRTHIGDRTKGTVSYTVHASGPQITVGLNATTYNPGDTARLTVSENIDTDRTFSVQDSSGAVWTQQSDNGTTVTFTTTTTEGGEVTATMTRTSDGATATGTVSYAVNGVTPPLWPGQKPGQLILGMSCGTACNQKESDLGQAYGVHRQFKNWGDWTGIAKDIQQDHAAGRLPWVSFKSPGGASGWQAVANGDYDSALRSLATTLKANDDKPVILTFHHEPSNDAPESQGVVWAAAYVHINDVLEAEGALGNVSFVPIVGDWLFNEGNRTQDPDNWVTTAVLQRAPFLGIDMYENASAETFATRIPLITDWMAARGFPNMTIGIGETGSTNYYAKSTALQWMTDSLTWATNHTNQVTVVSYFNSTANSRAGVYWPLDESNAKMTLYRNFLNNPLTSP